MSSAVAVATPSIRERGLTLRTIVYLVEDDADIRQLVAHHLQTAGFQVRSFDRIAPVLPQALQAKPALFILDIMVPGGDGLDLCKRIRQSPELAMTPIIFLTARTSEEDRVLGLELGGDDYIPKPFSPRELVARVKAVLRRFERPLTPMVLKIGNLQVDSGAMTLTVKGKPVGATATEFRLLDYLARNPGRVLTRDQILDSVWRDTQFVTPRSVDVYIRKLREKIEDNPDSPRLVKTVRGAGYRFEIPK